MKNKKVLDFLKWIWLVIVFLGAGWYIVTNFASISSYIFEIKIEKLFASFLLILFGKLLTSDLSFQSLRIVLQPISPKESFAITTLTQLGKYLPGGIWHFAGKFSVYKSRGMNTKEASAPMIIENIWLFSSAFVTGVLALLLSENQVVCQLVPFICGPKTKIALSIGFIVFWVAAQILIQKYIFNITVKSTYLIRLLIEQTLTWCIFGLSLWIIIPLNANLNTLFLTISAFSISWLAGYAAFFAPGGIGIREVVLTLILGSALSGDLITINVTLHRLLWVLIEILLGAGSALFIGMPFSGTEDKNLKRG